MSRNRVSLVLAALALAFFARAMAAQDYVPLTLEEAIEYIRTTPIEEVAADIVKLDALEHAVPSVTFPGNALVLLADGSFVITPLGPLTVSIADGGLLFRLTIAPQVVENPAPTGNSWIDNAIWAGVGAGAAFALVGLLSLFVK